MQAESSNVQRLSWLRPRFSIRSLLLATTIIASLFPVAWFGWFLLMNASTQWGAAAFWLTAFILAVSIMLAVNRQGRTRAYCTGFATVGLLYFLLVPCGLPRQQLGFTTVLDREVHATTRLSRFAYYEYVFPRLLQSFGPAVAGTPAFTLGPGRPGDDDFINVAELHWTLLFAFLGGWVSLLLYRNGGPNLSERNPPTQQR
jgi:hypothetical protein